MKKTLALLSILACLVIPVFAGVGVGIDLSSNYQHSLVSNFKGSMANAIGISFKTNGGAQFYLRNELGRVSATSGGETITIDETAYGLGVRAPLTDSIGANLFLGKATTDFVGIANFSAAGDRYREHHPIIDFGIYGSKNYGDVSLAIDVNYRHHALSEDISTLTADAKAGNINDRHAIRLGLRVGYGF